MSNRRIEVGALFLINQVESWPVEESALLSTKRWNKATRQESTVGLTVRIRDSLTGTIGTLVNTCAINKHRETRRETAQIQEAAPQSTGSVDCGVRAFCRTHWILLHVAAGQNHIRIVTNTKTSQNTNVVSCLVTRFYLLMPYGHL